MTSSRRAKRKSAIHDLCSSCPICHKSFPSSIYCGAIEHEELVLNHITKCSASASETKTLVNSEPKTSARLNTNNIKTFPVNTDKSSFELKDASKVVEDAKTANIATVAMKPAIDSPTPFTSEVRRSKSPCQISRKVGRLQGKSTKKSWTYLPSVTSDKITSDETMLLFGKTESNVYLTASDGYKESAIETVVPHRRRHSRQTNAETSDVLRCPICAKQFSALRYSNIKGLERAMTKHVEKCSQTAEKSKNSPAKSEKVLDHASDSMSISTPSIVESSPERTHFLSKNSTENNIDASMTFQSTEPGNFGVDCLTSASAGSHSVRNSYANIDNKSDTSKSLNVKSPEIDSGHLLAQTWWRPERVQQKKGQRRGEKKRKRPTSSPTDFKSPFDIESCLVAKETDVAKEHPVRESRRLHSQEKSRSQDDLKLNCPYCRRIFSPTWMDMTEDAMIRHISRCKARCTKIVRDNSLQNSVHATALTSASIERRMSLDSISNESTLSDLSGCSRPSGRSLNCNQPMMVLVSARRNASRNATMRAERARSIRVLLQGTPKLTLEDIILCDSNGVKKNQTYGEKIGQSGEQGSASFS